MAKNIILSARTAADIDSRVDLILKDLGNPEPPLTLEMVRELLQLDFGYYSINNPGLLQETAHKIRLAGKQILLRPTLLIDAVRKFDLKALYIPDQKRILLDRDEPKLKHRWNESHEIIHSVLPWHEGAMLGDDASTLIPSCHAQLEHEANYGAGKLLFLRNRFVEEALDLEQTISSVNNLAGSFGNTRTSTFWRCVETWGARVPILGMITGHPHPIRRKNDFDETNPCRHFIQSPAFAQRFSGVSEKNVFDEVVGYCSRNKGGPLGGGEVILTDDNGKAHLFSLETFSFHHNILTLGIYIEPFSKAVVVTS